MSEEKVPKKYIKHLSHEDLIKLCEKLGQPTTGSDDELAGRLQRKVKYSQLSKPMLVSIAKPMGISAREKMEDIINILVADKEMSKLKVEEKKDNTETTKEKEKNHKVKDTEKIKTKEKEKTNDKANEKKPTEKNKDKEKNNRVEEKKKATTSEKTETHKEKKTKEEKEKEKKPVKLEVVLKDVKSTPLSVARWNNFRKVDLAIFCSSVGLPVSKSKPSLIEQLIVCGFGMEDIKKPYLIHLCTIEERVFKKKNTVKELQQILKEKPNSSSATAKEPKKKSEKNNDFAVDFAKPLPMKKQAYRTKMQKLGLVEADQDVFHIIAHANGGADHADNYAFLMGSSFNRFIGNRFDHINCYIVGKNKAKKAVAISVMLNNYTGPKSDELYAKGKQDFKAMLKDIDSKK